MFVLENKKCFKLTVPINCDYYLNQRFNKSDEALCKSCLKEYGLNIANNKCIKCPSKCISCYFEESKRLVCGQCYLDYVLNKDKLCESCSKNLEIGGVGCIHCKYEYEYGINKCTDCTDDFIHIDNDYVCKLPSEVNLNKG